MCAKYMQNLGEIGDLEFACSVVSWFFTVANNAVFRSDQLSAVDASTYANIDTDECVLLSRRLVKSSNNYCGS